MPTVQENRLFLDLIQGKKFNSVQRDTIKGAIESKLNPAQLQQIANTNYSKDHMKEMISFFKNATYKDNKKLYAMFLDEKIDVKVLEQINKALQDKLKEDEILEFAKPEIYSVEQMNELRLFLKTKNTSKEYHDYIFDNEKTFDAMQSIREAHNMEIAFNEISSFDCHSDLYSMMINAIINGILPNEVEMILEVTNDKKEFETIVSGYLLGLDDEEIKCCLNGDERHLDFHLELMSEVHDENYMDKIMKIKEMDRRKLIECFETEDKFKDVLLQMHDSNQLDKRDQFDMIVDSGGKFNEISLFKKSDYLVNYVDGVCENDKKVTKLALKAYLLNEVSSAYHLDNYEFDKAAMSIVLNDLLHKRYGSLIEQREHLDYFLTSINDLESLLNQRVGDINQDDEYLSFSIAKDFDVTLKEYKDYYDIENITIRYGENHTCIISKKELEEMVIDFRKLKVNEHGRVAMTEKGRDI